MDIWHFHRTDLTNQITKAIQYNIMHSFTLFAQRRIGKTSFLNLDLKPALESCGYKTIYFSFADQIGNPIERFQKVLVNSVDIPFYKKIKIKEINFSWCKINLFEDDYVKCSILELLSIIRYQVEANNSQCILMLDEIQELTHITDADGFIGELRTALDLNKQYIKVIFTGSSQHQLLKMFSDSKAPFFHFGSTIVMEKFGRDFTDFLANRYVDITNKNLNKDEFFEVFLKLNQVTLSIREFISHHIMTNQNNLFDSLASFENEEINKNNYNLIWNNLLGTEKLILLGIINKLTNFYSEKFYNFAKLHDFEITNSKVQNAVKKLHARSIIIMINDVYEIEDLFFCKWIEYNIVIARLLL